MIEYIKKEDSGTTFAVFTSNDINFEVPIAIVEEANIQQHLQNSVDTVLQLLREAASDS